MAPSFKQTLNLPRTQFPMRASLAAREPERLAHWEQSKLYARIQQARASGEPYILHDGPPFTNGDVHIGTALNKILKDFVVRYQSMRGRRAPYVPGWDCHGLPIEFKVMQRLQQEGGELSPLEIRQACAEFSRQYIEKLRGQFQRLGILADWSEEYRTMDPAYEAEILRTFAHMVEQGLVYRSKKPVYWSIPVESALAEAEIEYKEHVSPSIYVAFPVPEGRDARFPAGSQVAIWTTTPWTLPANLAIALHPRHAYTFVVHGGKRTLVAKELAEKFIETCGLDGATTEGAFAGADFEGARAAHPFIARESLLVTAEYVTLESGTGCVHTAPGHGMDDYLTGLRYGLEIYNPLDDRGAYIDDGRIPAELVGKSVAEAPHGQQKGLSSANAAVLKLLIEKEALIHKEKYRHSYPHCWRSKTPVVFRAVDQWFVALDHDGLRKRALKAIDEVSWVPEAARNRITGAVESRPDWCISRQRSWGVPIPVFFDGAGEPLLDAEVIRGLAEKIATRGTDYWYEAEASELLEDICLPGEWEPRRAELKKGTDTLDVWIDSGTSNRAVLAQRDNLGWPADLYLEGSDQHRGWFQSSLWTGVITGGKAPYRTCLTHGFIVNEDKTKISKSDGKPMNASDFVDKYGADVVRLWVSSVDFRSDVPISDNIFDHVGQAYRGLRNTLRFLLGNLHDFEPARDALPYAKLKPLDRWALHELAGLVPVVTEAYGRYEFHRVYQLLTRFSTVTLSALYHDILKDRLYTLGPASGARRSAQTALHEIFAVFNRLLAPILLFTSDEAAAYAATDSDFAEHSVHLESWPEVPAHWRDEALASEMERLLALRERVNEKLEGLRQAKTIGQPLDAAVQLTGGTDDPLFQLAMTHAADLPELFIVSVVEVAESTGELSIEVRHAEGMRCPRCWRWVPALEPVEEGEVCPRCAEALAGLAKSR